MSNIVYFGSIAFKEETFTLGEVYVLSRGTNHWGANHPRLGMERSHILCEFIKVTSKGFNFLNLETAKCMFKNHLYSKRYAGKGKLIPKRETRFTVRIYADVQTKLVKKEKIA